MKRDPWQPLGTAIAAALIAIRETAAAIDRWLARASRNPDDPDESDATAASPVADYRSNA